MRKRFFNWQGHRFISLDVEGEPAQSLQTQSHGVFRRAAAELVRHGLSVDTNTVRTRIFGRTREARAAGSQARVEALRGPSRASGSSYISPSRFASTADVALELFAMAQPIGGEARRVTEHNPVQAFIRHLAWGPMIFFPGMTSELPNLEEQYQDVLSRASGLLKECNCYWSNVVGISCFLHKDCDPESLLAGIGKCVPVPLNNAKVEFVEGFSRPTKMVEIEITARRG
jgi:enamine deaminase RidA (YjgF/YER057c/UK114 family)